MQKSGVFGLVDTRLGGGFGFGLQVESLVLGVSSCMAAVPEL